MVCRLNSACLASLSELAKPYDEIQIVEVTKGFDQITKEYADFPDHVAQAKSVLDKYKRANPELEKWWTSVEETVMRTRKLITPFGRLRIFLDRMCETTFKSAVAFVPQSTIGDQINRAFFAIDNALPDGCFIILQVHDEVVVECPFNLVNECIKIIEKELERPIRINDRDLVIPSDVSIGSDWFNLESIDNIPSPILFTTCP